MATDEVSVDTNSLGLGADVILGSAGRLYAGRPEPGMTSQARAPYVHSEVADASHLFATHASDQYLDAVALLAVLSTKLRNAGGRYAGTDVAAADRLLNSGLSTPGRS